MNKFFLGLTFSLLVHFGLFFMAHQFSFKSEDSNYSQKIGISEIRTKLQFEKRIQDKIVEKKESMTPQIKETKKQKKNEEYTDLNKSNTNKGQESILAKYLVSVRELIIKHKFKSPMAKRLKLKGQVEVGFSIVKPNNLNSLRVIKTSGKLPIDDSALRTIQNIKEFPSIPSELALNKIPVTFEVIYE